MDILSIVIVGIVATGYMTLVNWLVARGRLVRGDMLSAVGSFLIPEPIRSTGVALTLHVLVGIGFTAVYAYIFGFVEPDTMQEYLALGSVVGLVHGFFVSYFMLLGFSALQRGEQLRPFGATAAIMNIVSHIVFGFGAGLGLGYAALTGTVLWYAVFGIAGLIALVALSTLLISPGGRQVGSHA